MSTPLPCPFCGSAPALIPTDPAADGNAWGGVACINDACPAKPGVGDGEAVADDRGVAAYQEAAIRRWNMMDAHAATPRLVWQYRSIVASLEQFKASRYYHGTQVRVESPRYTGEGIAVTDGTCWPDHVAVAIPNGNTWRYPMECVTPIEPAALEGKP